MRLHPYHNKPMVAFAWTAPALLHLAKTETRRNYSSYYADTFKDDRRGNRPTVFVAMNRRLEWGGEALALLRVERAGAERRSQISEQAYEREGFPFFERYPSLLPQAWRKVNLRQHFHEWRLAEYDCFTIRFTVLEVLATPPVLPEEQLQINL